MVVAYEIVIQVKVPDNTKTASIKGENPKKELSTPDERPREIFNLWNEINPTKKFGRLTGSMRDKIKTRLSQEPDIETWKRCFELVRATEYLHKNSWCSLDWVMKNEDNYLKILSGKYGPEAEKPAEVKYLTDNDPFGVQ